MIKKKHTLFIKECKFKTDTNHDLETLMRELSCLLPLGKLIKDNNLLEETKIIKLQEVDNGIFALFCNVDKELGPLTIKIENNEITISSEEKNTKKDFPHKIGAIFIKNNFLVTLDYFSFIKDTLEHLFETQDLISKDTKFSITHLTQQDIIKKIRDIGVRNIHLNIFSKTREHRFTQIKQDFFSTLFKRTLTANEIRDASDLSGNINLSINKNIELQTHILEEVAETIYDGHFASYTILLKNGVKITPKDFIIQKPISLDKMALNCFKIDDAMKEMINYMNEYMNTNI